MRRFLPALILTGSAFAAGMVIGPKWSGSAHPHIVRRVGDYARDFGNGGGPRTAIGSVHALGRIEPDGGIYAVGAPAGARLDRVLVEVGQAVAEHQELAYVEGHTERTAQIETIAAQLAEARDQSRAEEEYEVILEREAALEREDAEALEGPEIKTQESNIEVLAEKAKTSRRDHDHLVELKRDKRSTISAQELDRQYLVMRQDETALNSARADLLKFKTGRLTRRAKLDLQLKKAKAASRRTRLAIPIRSLEKQLELARAQLDQTVVRAPRSGRILALLAKPGEAIGPRPIIQLGDTRRMYVVAEVDEDEISLIKKGQKATVTNHAWNRPYTGVVESWALMVSKNDVLGLDPAAAAYSRVVEIKIRLNEPCDDLRDRTYMQVNASIDVQPPAAMAPKEAAGPDPTR